MFWCCFSRISSDRRREGERQTGLDRSRSRKDGHRLRNYSARIKEAAAKYESISIPDQSTRPFLARVLDAKSLLVIRYASL